MSFEAKNKFLRMALVSVLLLAGCSSSSWTLSTPGFEMKFEHPLVLIKDYSRIDSVVYRLCADQDCFVIATGNSISTASPPNDEITIFNFFGYPAERIISGEYVVLVIARGAPNPQFIHISYRLSDEERILKLISGFDLT